jgi:hypothetical protein
MATTLLQFDATSFDGDVVPVTAGDLPAVFDMINGRTVLAFIDGANESAAVTKGVHMPQAYAAGTLTAVLTLFSSAASNEFDLEVQVEAVTSGDAVDFDAATSFDTANAALSSTLSATAGTPGQHTITLTNNDSVAAGDMVRFLVRRDSDDAADDNTGTMYLVSMEIREA